jgi:tetratricopeptide (TPR) repeat protein
MNHLGVCLDKLGQFDRAQATSQEALKIAQRTLSPDDELMRRLKINAALDLNRSGRHDEAAKLLEEVSEVQRSIYGIRNMATLTTTVWLAKTNLDRGNFEKATALYQELLDSSRSMFGPDHAQTMEATYYLAYCLRRQGNYLSSLDLTRQILSWRRENLGPTHPATFVSMRDMIRLLSRAKQVTEAREMIDQIVRILPTDEWAERDYLAWLLATEPADEIRDGKRSVELANVACELTKFTQSSPIDTLAAAYAETGDYETAIIWENKAIELTSESSTRARYTRHLNSYQNHKPWRDEP